MNKERMEREGTLPHVLQASEHMDDYLSWWAVIVSVKGDGVNGSTRKQQSEEVFYLVLTLLKYPADLLWGSRGLRANDCTRVVSLFFVIFWTKPTPVLATRSRHCPLLFDVCSFCFKRSGVLGCWWDAKVLFRVRTPSKYRCHIRWKKTQKNLT